jgi:hypothetical protein
MPAANEKLKNEWKNRFEQWRASGKTIKAWCEEQKISLHVFYYWRTKFKSVPNIAQSSSNPFIEVTDRKVDSGLSLQWYGIVVCLSKNFDEKTLARLLQILRRL